MVACSPDEKLTRDTNIGGTENVLSAMDSAGTRRIVFASSVFTYGGRPAEHSGVDENSELTPDPAHFYGFHKAHVERLLATSSKEWVSIRPGLVLGRTVNNMLLRLLGSPAFPNVENSADRPLQVVHPEDVHRVFVNAVVGEQTGGVNLAAPGQVTVRDFTSRLGRPLFPARKQLIEAGLGFLYRRELVEASPAEFNLLLSLPIMDTSRLVDDWGYAPAWSADECLDDFVLAVRGRVSLGKRVYTLPWRTPLVQDMPTCDEAPTDGVPLHAAGPEGLNGEFDSPVDPRFPTFVATNLSEALPGPFSPASESATVRGLRAGGVSISERLRLSGVVGREVATRSIGTFGHRLYGGVTSTYFMATSMPGTNPDGLTDQFFGRELGKTPVFGDQRPPVEKPGIGRRLSDLLSVGLTGIGLLMTSSAESREYVADVDRLERLLPQDLGTVDDNRLESLITLARDLVVHGWVLASWGALLCTATATAAVRIGDADTPTAGREVASGRALAGIRRLAALARTSPEAVAALVEPVDPLGAVRKHAPALYREIMAELQAVGHRGPAECELRSTCYADDPAQFARVIAKSLGRVAEPGGHASRQSLGLSPRQLVARLAGRQIRDRETRRDKVVRSTAILRRLMREQGRRLIERDLIDDVDDIFFFQVDELDALPPDTRAVVARRRAEMERLRDVQPPSVFSGTWTATPTVSPLKPGQSIYGLGVSGGRITGRVRIVDHESIDDLEPGEILVAEVTDVGYTPSFAYAGAVVTNLGGPMSHAAIVAREFGATCVVSATNATRRLATGDLVEVDGTSGQIMLLKPAHGETSTGTT
ncbi:conserved hypothetical protein [Mycolicibacter sinensis]|uniref:Phosphoenolpyruvate synthase n=2 Tax=Mycolicibacter sinensis (strain JDM601) TaxID=875328 RepID=F5YRP1_MYCSD|nr:conserved hypothetical protein [Mycolicibacter sinensis]